jgi:hypothetical protein
MGFNTQEQMLGNFDEAGCIMASLKTKRFMPILTLQIVGSHLQVRMGNT